MQLVLNQVELKASELRDQTVYHYQIGDMSFLSTKAKIQRQYN